ncbi:hypothetical protein MRS76_20215 [Rhizobiaceae bacterium n13]|uniref:Uncharacterized protein n=1 Tax=Ferirhizobium litorale TaxID=2927786 RepID=A0AAE3U5M4_9HYPH|nr:hypothetical protein [Fererhizobium litorale]MDI7864267.1 hypothetical protein [Fererhizobium litorale]MDI7924628.1 hypothetical protein [Fererhizobium litorale]
MAIVDEERRKMLSAHSIGPRMIGYLEIIGIERLADLKGQNAGEIGFRINAALGRDHITCQGLRALKSLIDHAEQQT